MHQHHFNAIVAVLAFLLFPAVAPASNAQIAQCKSACQNVQSVITADHSKFAAEMNAKIDILSSFWQATTHERQQKHEERIANLESVVEKLQKELKSTREAMCPLRYNNKCFWAMLQDDVTISVARQLCGEIPGGKPANIYDRDHYHLLLQYMRTLIPESKSFAYLWLGMTIDTQQHDTVAFNDGKKLDFVLKWRTNYPSSNLDYTALMVMARTDGSTKLEGIYNQNPAYGKPGVLCEA